jgi:hypothetical protein
MYDVAPERDMYINGRRRRRRLIIFKNNTFKI